MPYRIPDADWRMSVQFVEVWLNQMCVSSSRTMRGLMEIAMNF
jgi:hypothetical protein